MKRSVLIVAASLTMGLLSNNLIAQITPKTKQDTIKKTVPMPRPDTTKKVVPPPPSTTTAPATTPAAADTSKKDIDATLAIVADESTLATAIKTANLNADLKGPGPFTVFAPNNNAFTAIPPGKLDSLMKDPVKLATMVKAHVVAGKYDKAGLIKALTAGKGTAVLKTIDGQTLTLAVKDKKLHLTDAHGNSAEVTSFDAPATNGVIHGINGVFMYK